MDGMPNIYTKDSIDESQFLYKKQALPVLALPKNILKHGLNNRKLDFRSLSLRKKVKLKKPNNSGYFSQRRGFQVRSKLKQVVSDPSFSIQSGVNNSHRTYKYKPDIINIRRSLMNSKSPNDLLYKKTRNLLIPYHSIQDCIKGIKYNINSEKYTPKQNLSQSPCITQSRSRDKLIINTSSREYMKNSIAIETENTKENQDEEMINLTVESKNITTKFEENIEKMPKRRIIIDINSHKEYYEDIKQIEKFSSKESLEEKMQNEVKKIYKEKAEKGIFSQDFIPMNYEPSVSPIKVNYRRKVVLPPIKRIMSILHSINQK